MIKARIEFLQSNLKDGEAALISSDADRLYYTGFHSSAGYVAVTSKKAVFLIDFRYFEKAKQRVDSCEVILLKSFAKQLGELFADEKIKTVYLETETVSLSAFSSLKKRLPDFKFSADNKLQKLITKQRSIKSADEIVLIKKAQKMTDETFSYIIKNICAGRTEREVMLDMEFYMRRLGSEGVSFDFIVVSGKNSSMPHGVPTDKRIEKGDFITMDFGAVCGGYRSDMTRTVAVGEVGDKQKEVYNIVLKAQEATIDFIRSGVVCKDVDRVARDIITKAGYGDCFGHGLGHSVGIEIHENPACNTVCDTVMEEGMIMTVEPGIYIENQFGVRIEDMVVVTEKGCENLTESRKDLIVL
ncbi:MAG: aminopeptidase P family protein [Acutalibacteraceae bacterium]|nr:aminopeptidase P family protein [Acutalibacteraceae bacterium]